MFVLLLLILFVLLAGFGFISRSTMAAIQLTLIFVALAGILSGLWFMALRWGTTYVIVVTVLSGLIGAAFLAAARAIIITTKARRDPEKYVVGVCAECGHSLMRDPLGANENDPYAHIFKPDPPHKAVMAADA